MRSRNADFILPVHRPINKMAIVPARTMLDSLVDEKGRTLKVEIRQSDGYFNATLMCQSAGKQMREYNRQKGTASYLGRLSSIVGIPTKDLVSDTIRSEGTWVHRKVAIHLAQWISPDFAIWVTDLVERYVTGQVTTEQSRRAAAEVARATLPVVDDKTVEAAFPGLLKWHAKRGEGRRETKNKNAVLQKVTGNKASGGHFGEMNDAINLGATGRRTQQLRVQAGWTAKCKKTPRDRMQHANLCLIAYQEEMVPEAMEQAYEHEGRELTVREAMEAGLQVSDRVKACCEETGGDRLPLLQHAPPTLQRVKQVLALPAPKAKQQNILEWASLKTMPALPPVPRPSVVDHGDLYDD